MNTMTWNLISDPNRTNNAVFLIDLKSQTFCYVNDYACEKLGYSRDELLRMRIQDIDPLINEASLQKIAEQIARQGFSLFETYHLTKDGHLFPVEVSGNIFDYPGGSFGISIAREMTEHKQKDEQLALLDYAFNYVDEAIFLVNSDAQLLQVNEKACLSLGYSREELLSMSISDIDPDFNTELWQKLLAEYEKGMKSSITIETRHRRKDGVIFPAEVRGHYIAYQGQQYSFVMVRDITARKAAEKQLSLLNYALDHSKEEVWLIDENARFHYVNQAACRSIGCTYQEMLQLSVLNIKPDYGLEQWQEDWQRTKTTGSCTFETSHQSKEGDIFPVEVNASYFELDGQGYSLSFSHDITERQRVEETLKFVAQRGWKDRHESFLVALSQYLAQLFQVDYVIIDKIGTSPTQAETVALCVKGTIVPNMQYDLKGTPCADVMNGKLCCYPERVQQLFPDDALLVEMQAESYAGLPLWDTAGNVVGLIAVIDSKPLHNTDFISSILQLVVTSVAAELERQHSEQALMAREQQFRTLAENVPGILIRYDEKCCMRYLNQKLIEGCPQDTGLKIGQTLVQAYPNDPLFEELHEIIRKVIETGQPSETERYFPNHQGGGTWVFRHVAETDDSGNIIGALALGQDISERKRMENELAAREHEFRTLAENIPDNLLRYDLQCQLHYMNLATMLNLAPEAVPTIGNTPSQSFPNNSVAVDIHNAIKHAIETGEACDMEIPWLNANAGIGVHHLRCVAERDSKGNITGALMLGRDISERKKMEDALAAREREFRILVETSPAPIFRYDTNCRRIYVNPVVEQMTGKTAAELLNRVPSDASVLRQSEGEKLESVLRQVIQTGQAAEGEIECVIANGETRHYYNRYAPELDADGQVISVILVALDITERKHAEQLLLQREQEFRSLAENMPDNLIRYDLQARVRYLNPAITRSLAPEVLPKLNKTLVESFPDNEKVIAAQLIIERVIATGATIDTEFCVPNPEGEMRTHHLRYVAEYDNKGNIIGVLVIGRDLTERKQMEMAVQQHEQEFRTLVDNLPTTVLRYNHHCQRIYANPAYLQIMGGSEAELLNKPLEETWVATNLSVEAYKAILHEVMRDGEKKEVILEWTDRNDKLVCHVLKIVPEYAIDGQIQSALVLGFDLSEQRKQQLIEASRQQVFEKTARNNSLDTILEQVALYVESSKSGRYCAILLVDEAKNQLQLVAAPSFPESYFAKSNTVTLDIKSKHCLGWVASALCEKRVIMENIHAYPCDSLCQKFIREIGAVACWSEPIMSSSNQLLGVVTLYLNQAAQPDENDLALLLQASHLSAIAIERKRIEQQMFYQASYDILTSLPNRWLFHDRLQEEISKADAKGHQLALLFIDLDHFKEVNDTLGHKIGDNLLVHAAHRIQNCVRQSDIVARLGGDEFVVILPELGTVLFVERTAEAIIQAMTQPFKLGEYQTYISASVGIAMYPQDAVQAETLVSYADQAMYAAKQAGRNSFNFFTRSMQEQAQQRLYLVNSLRDALEKNQFEVYYQPIIEVASGKAVKAEALLRWHHPVLGMVSPVVFIPLAEETDLIHSIGSWVFCQAADMAKHWNALSGENEPRKVSINMSPRQLIKGHGDQIAIAYLQAIALDSTHIVVEITEGLLLDDSPDITEKMERLRNGGIQLSLDDFGTGYSAMAYLKKFDINYLKIDRSFVRELETNADDRAITEAIVVMAHRLGLKVIAEGVETEGQRALLAAVGCEYIQGYFYAKPMPIETFWSYVLE